MNFRLFVVGMPRESEIRHPAGLRFAVQRQVLIDREVRGLTWKQVAAKAKTLQGKKPRPRYCADVDRKFNRRKGRVQSKDNNCGNTPRKVDKAVEGFLVKRLKKLRKVGPCTPIDLQLALAGGLPTGASPRPPLLHPRNLLRALFWAWPQVRGPLGVLA